MSADPSFSDPLPEAEHEKIGALQKKLSQDPRLVLLKWKYDPDLGSPDVFVGNGLQKAKIAYDPSHLPWLFGLTVKMYRAGDAARHRKELNKVSEVVSGQTAISDEEISALKHNMNAQVARHNSKATFSIITSMIPGLPILLFGARKAAESLVVKFTRKVDSHNEPSDNPSYQVHENYLASKAFFTYLGLPVNKDPLFRRWERERLFLKGVYGAMPEDDLRTQEPNQMEMFRLKRVMDETPKEDWDQKKLGHCPLWFLWHIYECWTGLYWDKHMNFAWKVLQDPNHRYREDRNIMRVWAAESGRMNHPHVRKANVEDLDQCMEIYLKLKIERMDIMRSCYPFAFEAIRQTDFDDTYRAHFKNFIEKDRIWVYQTDPEKADSFDCWVVWGNPNKSVPLFEKKKLDLLKAKGNIHVDHLKEIHNIMEARHLSIEKRRKKTKDLYGIVHYFLSDGTNKSFEHLKTLIDVLCDEAISCVIYACAHGNSNYVTYEELKGLQGRQLTGDDCENLHIKMDEFYKSQGFEYEQHQVEVSKSTFDMNFFSHAEAKIEKIDGMYLNTYFRQSIVPLSCEVKDPNPMVN